LNIGAREKTEIKTAVKMILTMPECAASRRPPDVRRANELEILPEAALNSLKGLRGAPGVLKCNTSE